MRWKRNISSYPIWIFMILIGLAGLVLSTINACFAFGANEVVGAVICVVLLTLAGSGTYFLHLYRKNHPEEEEYPMWVSILSGVILLGCITCGVVLALFSIPSAELTSPYFEVARVQAGCRAPYFVHGATNTYVAFLNKLFFVFGNRGIVGIYAQIVLWVLVVLLLGIGIWFAVSKKSAVVVMVLAAVMPALRSEAVVYSPVLLYLLAWTAVFAWLCFSLRIGGYKWLTCVNFALVGICTYFDLSGILLAVAYLTMVHGRNRKAAAAESNRIPFAKIALGIIGFAAAFVLCIGLDASFSEKPLADVFAVWFQTYSLTPGFTKELYQSVTSLEFIPMYFMICLGAFAFWRDKSKDAFKGWMFQLTAVLVFFLLGLYSERVTGSVYLAIHLYILAGVGLESVLTVVEEIPEKETVASKNFESETSHKARKIPRLDELDIWAPLDEEAAADVVKKEKPEAPITEPAADSSKEAVQPEIKFLENPLPLPKKHEKRAVDFPISPSEDDDYDYAVAEDDDYDIR